MSKELEECLAGAAHLIRRAVEIVEGDLYDFHTCDTNQATGRMCNTCASLTAMADLLGGA